MRVPEPSYAVVDLVATLINRKRFLVGMAALGGLLFGGVAFSLRPQYTATALIMPPPKAQSLSSVLMGQLGAVASSISPGLGLKDPADLYIGILKSRTIGDDLIRQFDLTKVYTVKTNGNARKALLRHASFVTGKDSLIKISVEDTDPKRAADMANAFIAELYKQDNRLALTESGQRRLFFERELKNEQDLLASAEDSLQQIEKKTGVVHASGQAEATLRSIEQLSIEIGKREVALKRLELAATEENPTVEGIRQEISALRSQLSKLESANNTREPGDPLIPFGTAPQVSLEILRGIRAVKYHEAVFGALSQQYEIAKIDEAKESQQIQVVDVAVPPEEKSWPPKLLLILLGVVSFTIIGCVVAFAQEEFRNQWLLLRARLSTAQRG